MQWAIKSGVVPLPKYPYTARTDDCQASFNTAKQLVFAGAEIVDLSKPDAIITVGCGALVLDAVLVDSLSDRVARLGSHA